MGSERDAAWYDQHWSWKYRRGPVQLNAQAHLPLWTYAAEWAVNQQQPVVDLGCGFGPVARMLAKDDRFHGSYLGFDFSLVALSMAKKDVPDPRFSFVQADLVRPESHHIWSGLTDHAFLVCEVLEHIEDDYSLIRSIPPGAAALLSVPTFDADAHVRHFVSADTVRARYEKFFNRLNIKPVHATNKQTAWFVCTGCVAGATHG